MIILKKIPLLHERKNGSIAVYVGEEREKNGKVSSPEFGMRRAEVGDLQILAWSTFLIGLLTQFRFGRIPNFLVSSAKIGLTNYE